MVKQISVVAILMIVQGVLEWLMGLLLVAAGFFMPALMEFMKEQQKQQGGQGAMPMPFLPEELGDLLTVIYLALGAGCLLAGTLKLIAGIRNLRYRGRVLGIVAQIMGIFSLPTCYCAPTSLGVMIYGLIVNCNGDVVQAFEMGEKGSSPEEIKEYFERKYEM